MPAPSKMSFYTAGDRHLQWRKAQTLWNTMKPTSRSKVVSADVSRLDNSGSRPYPGYTKHFKNLALQTLQIGLWDILGNIHITCYMCSNLSKCPVSSLVLTSIMTYPFISRFARRLFIYYITFCIYNMDTYMPLKTCHKATVVTNIYFTALEYIRIRANGIIYTSARLYSQQWTNLTTTQWHTDAMISQQKGRSHHNPMAHRFETLPFLFFFLLHPTF